MNGRPVTRLLAAAGALALGGLGAVALPTAALAVPVGGMVLECADGPTLTRTNGLSWWGLGSDGTPDGSVYVTTRLRITSLEGELQYAMDVGDDRPQLTSSCVAQHGPFDDGYPGSIWDVTLVRTR